MKAELDSVPNSLANSIASSIMTLGGVVLAENWISQMAQRRMAKSTWLILSRGHLGAAAWITLSISGRREIMSSDSEVVGSELPEL